MQYKGDDLDLRVPGTRQPAPTYPVTQDYEASLGNGRWPRSPTYGTAGYGTAGPDPLWVDETVLACCNYAYDIATANGAGEVGLEHLVNALTRVENAARILEARGVRDGQLRRESASLIASEIPIAAGSERNPPRRSPDFEDVLRRAAEQAGRRGAAATVDDILWVILHYGRDVAAVQLLRRHTPDLQRPDLGRGRETLMPEPRAQAPIPPMPMTPVQPAYAGAFDTVTSRISLIEESLRSLHVELSSERKAIADLIRDTQRDIVAQRGDAASLRNDLAQRLEGLERGLQARPESTRLTVQLSDRIQSLEKAVHGGLGEGARNWAALGQRLQTLETSLATAGSRDVAIDHKPLLDRIAGLEIALEARLTQSLTQSLAQVAAQAAAQTVRATSGLTDRLQSMERILEAGAGEGGRHWTQLSERFGALETSFRARPPTAAAPEMAEFIERFGGLERAVRAGFGDSLRSTATISDRLATVEKAAIATQTADDEALLLLDDRMQSIERMLQDQAGVRGAPGQIELGSIDLGSIDLGSLAGPLTQRLTAIDQQSAERAASLEGLLRETAGRIAAIEQRVVTASAAQDESMRGRDREVGEMHEAIVRLSENQHTLASAIADWRHESHTDLGAVNAQFERLQSQGASMVAATDAAVTDFPSVARSGTIRTSLDRQAEANTKTEYAEAAATPPRETQQPPAARGRGFWWWLFGTGNVGQANRDAEMQWQRLHKSLKPNRDRRQDRV